MNLNFESPGSIQHRPHYTDNDLSDKELEVLFPPGDISPELFKGYSLISASVYLTEEGLAYYVKKISSSPRLKLERPLTTDDIFYGIVDTSTPPDHVFITIIDTNLLGPDPYEVRGSYFLPIEYIDRIRKIYTLRP